MGTIASTAWGARVYSVGPSWRLGVLASCDATRKKEKPPRREAKKKPAASYSRTGESRTTLGDGALNFRVRNGNGCDNSSMATGKKPFSWELKRLTTHNEMRGMISHHVKF